MRRTVHVCICNERKARSRIRPRMPLCHFRETCRAFACLLTARKIITKSYAQLMDGAGLDGKKQKELPLRSLPKRSSFLACCCCVEFYLRVLTAPGSQNFTSVRTHHLKVSRQVSVVYHAAAGAYSSSGAALSRDSSVGLHAISFQLERICRQAAAQRAALGRTYSEA